MATAYCPMCQQNTNEKEPIKMFSRIARQMAEFHWKMYGEGFGMGKLNPPELRVRLHNEENQELIDELEAVPIDIAKAAKELADVVVIAYGTAHSLGIPLDDVLDLVHESNMSKLDSHGLPVKRDDGKILKGPNYKAPDVSALLTELGVLQ